MTPRAIRAQARVLGATLLLALASSDTRAGDLYQWVTEDGRIEIGTTPPLGAAAQPWSPGQEAAAQPAPPAAAAPAPAATQRVPSDRRTESERRARGRLEEKCSAQKATVDKATQKIRILESQIARLDKKIEELEATEVAYSRTSCRSQDVYGPSASDCMTSSFHRDAEIARTQDELEDAQQKLGDLEQRARSATSDSDENCAPAAAGK